MPRMTLIQDARASELAELGLSLREVAAQVGVTDKAIPGAIRRHRGRRGGVPVRDMIERWLAGRSMKDLLLLDRRELLVYEGRVMRDDPVKLESFAQDWGVSRQRVHQVELRMMAKISEAMKRTH